MNSIVKRLSKKTFVRNVATVAAGTAAAQVITFIFSPIITRIYGPEAYGIWGVFMSLALIISPIAALTFPIAIVLPKNDSEAKSIIRLSLYTSGAVALALILILFFFYEPIISLLNLDVINSYIYLLPLVIIFSALLQVCEQWLIRTKQFRVTAKSAMLNTLILNSAKTGLGFINPVATVLVILATLGSALHACLLFLGAVRSGYEHRDVNDEKLTLRKLVNKYKDFPIYRAPQTFIHTISQNMPVLFLASFFGPVAAGFYSLSRTVLGKPIALLGKSVGDVFYPRITEAAHRKENLSKLIMKATLALAAVGSLPFGIIVVFGPWVFGFVFGSEWSIAGEYARWLAIGFFFGFINRPSAMAIPVLNLQRHYLIYEIASGILRIGILFLGYALYNDEIVTVVFFSLASVVTNAFLILYTVHKSKHFNMRLSSEST